MEEQLSLQQPEYCWSWTVLAFRTVWCAAVWWILTDGAPDSWIVGAPTVLVAAVVSTRLMPPLTFTFTGACAFVVFFLWESLRGGIDVARRALHRKLPLSPGLMQHRLRVASPEARVSLTNTLSLLPGTLSADLEPEILRVHALDAGPEVRDSLEQTEHRIAALFGTRLIAPERDTRPR